MGHAGTLDPLASGLVIICTGKATKQITQYQEMDKAYEAEIRLGATTPSFDLETEVDHTFPWEHITEEMLEEALIKLSGPQDTDAPNFFSKKRGRKKGLCHGPKRQKDGT